MSTPTATDRARTLSATDPLFFINTSKSGTEAPFVYCEYGVPGPNGIRRQVIVSGLTCEEATRMHLGTVFSYAPFSAAEKEWVPFGKIPVYDKEHQKIGDFKDLTTKESGVLRPCAFTQFMANRGYIEHVGLTDNPCQNLDKFVTAYVMSLVMPNDDM